VKDPAIEDLYTVGTVVKLLKMIKNPEGNLFVLAQGVSRMEIVEYIKNSPYYVGWIEELEDIIDEENNEGLVATIKNLKVLFSSIAQLANNIPNENLTMVLNAADPGLMADLMVEQYPGFSLQERQEILETLNVKERLYRVTALLYREKEDLELGKGIPSQAQREMDKPSREQIIFKHGIDTKRTRLDYETQRQIEISMTLQEQHVKMLQEIIPICLDCIQKHVSREIYTAIFEQLSKPIKEYGRISYLMASEEFEVLCHFTLPQETAKVILSSVDSLIGEHARGRLLAIKFFRYMLDIQLDLVDVTEYEHKNQGENEETAYYMRYIIDDEKEISLESIDSGLKSIDSKYHFEEWDREGEFTDLYYEEKIYGAIEIERVGIEYIDEEIQELIEDVKDTDGTNKEHVLQILQKTKTIVVVEVLSQGKEADQILEKLDHPLWQWLSRNYHGVLKVDSKGYYVDSQLILEVE